jgi:predicted small secreted protein
MKLMQWMTALLLVCSLGLVACKEEGTMEKMGKKMDEAGEDMKEAAEDMADDVEEAAEEVKDAVDDGE